MYQLPSADSLRVIALQLHISAWNAGLACQFFCLAKCGSGPQVIEVGIHNLERSRNAMGAVLPQIEKDDRFVTRIADRRFDHMRILWIIRSEHSQYRTRQAISDISSSYGW